MTHDAVDAGVVHGDVQMPRLLAIGKPQTCCITTFVIAFVSIYHALGPLRWLSRPSIRIPYCLCEVSMAERLLSEMGSGAGHGSGLLEAPERKKQ